MCWSLDVPAAERTDRCADRKDARAADRAAPVVRPEWPAISAGSAVDPGEHNEHYCYATHLKKIHTKY